MNRKRNLHNFRKHICRIICLVMAMAFSCAIVPQADLTAFAAGNSVTVANSAQLKAALADQNVSEIIIDGTTASDGGIYLPVDEPLTVNRAVSISSKNGKEVIIARSNTFKATDDNPAIFNVKANGNLTLNSRVTMTGEQVKVVPSTNVGLSTSPYYLELYGSNNPYDADPGNNIRITNSPSTHIGRIWVDSDGYLALKKTGSNSTWYMKSAGAGYYIHDARDLQYDIKVYDTDGKSVTSLVPGNDYVLYDPYWKKYLSITNANDTFTRVDNVKNATSFTANGSAGSVTVDKRDGSENNGDPWKNTEIKAGGYFIHSANGGQVTINEQVTLRDIKTAGDVSGVAPVYIGGGSTFTMNGGFITRNDVGYIPAGDESRSNGQNVKTIAKEIAAAKMTNTAGGIIITGNGTTGNLNGGQIGGNRADAGGIIVTDKASVTMKNGSSIANNVGYHHAGAAQVERGGKLVMDGGEMFGNVAWHKGGAVWATQWGTGGYADVDWSVWPKSFPNLRNPADASPDDGIFIMNDGVIADNTAFARAGAIEVESNGVILNGGEISGNKCRSLGGAIYVEGDAASYSYTLTLNNAYIGENRSVTHTKGSANGSALDQENYTLNRYLSNGVLTGGGNDSWDNDFQGNMGNGGGVWLCPVGGTSVFAGNSVIIDNNDAAKNNGGEDFFLCRGNGAMLVQNLNGTWVNEATGTKVNYDDSKGTVLNGPLPLTNGDSFSPTDASGVAIKGNLSRDGGGIACNGTLLFGSTQDVDRYDARINITKEWLGVTPTSVTFEIGYRDANGNFVALKDASTDKKYEFEMDGHDDSSENDNNGSGGNGGSAVGEQAPENGKWVASAFIPAYVTLSDGSSYTLYKLKDAVTNEVFDPTVRTDLTKIRQAVQAGHSLEAVEWKLAVREKDANFRVTIRDIEVDNAKTQVTVQPVPLYNPATGNMSGNFSIYFTTLELTQPIVNESNGIEFTKLASNNNRPLQGAEFSITDAAAGNAMNAWYVPGTRDIDNPQNPTIANHALNTQPIVADANGKVRITTSMLKPGKVINTNSKYLLFETKAPAGYQRKTTPWLVSTDNLGNVTITEVSAEKQGKAIGKDKQTITSGPDNVFCNWWPFSWYTDAGNTNLKITNDWAPVKIEKTGLGNNPLGGAKFALYEVSGTGYLRVQDHKVVDDSIESEDGTGILRLPVKKAGLYWLFETEAPNNYVRAKSPWLVHVDANRNVTVIGLSSGNYGKFTNGSFQLVTGTYLDGANNLRNWITANQPRWSKEWFNLASSTSVDNGNYTFLSANDSSAQGVVISGNKIRNNIEVEFEKVDKENSDTKLTSAEFDLYHAVPTTNPETNGYRYQVDPNNSNKINSNPIVSANGKYRLPIIDSGMYLLFEIKAPAGFIRPAAPWGIWVKPDGTVEAYKLKTSRFDTYQAKYQNTTNVTDIVIDNTEYERLTSPVIDNTREPIELYKVDETDDTKKLGGAKFVLCEAVLGSQNCYSVKNASGNATVWSTAIKGSNGQPRVFTSEAETGKIVIDNIEDGTYLLFETEAPKGFVRSASPWVIKVETTATSRNVTVKKVKAGFKNKVYKEGNVLIDVDPTTSADQQTVVKRWWQDGADSSNGWFETMSAEEPYNLANEPGYLTKVDENDATITLEGAKFELYHAYTQQMRGYTSVRRSDSKITTLSSDSDGKIHLPSSITSKASERTAVAGLSGVYADGYLLIETEAPSGYERASRPWWIKVDASGNLTVATTTANKRGNSAGGLPYWYTTDFTNSSEGLKIANAPGKLKLTKVDKYDHNNTLKGARFAFYKASYMSLGSGVYKYMKSGNKIGESSESGTDGVFSLPPILTENSSQYLFIMEEIKAPEGYEVSDTPWLVSVTKDSAYYWNYDIYENGAYYKYVTKAWPLNEYGSNPNAEEYVISSNCDYSTFVENAPSINLIKVDATTVCYCPCDDMTQITPCEGEDGSDETVYLPNVSFDLYRSSSSWNKTGSPIMEAVSNENGLVELGELADGYYLLYETSNPNASYMVEKKPWRIQVSKNKIIKLMYPQNGTYEESLDKKYITNSPLYDLPNAGGIGAHWFSLIGALMMAFAVMMLLSGGQRRREQL